MIRPHQSHDDQAVNVRRLVNNGEAGGTYGHSTPLGVGAAPLPLADGVGRVAVDEAHSGPLQGGWCWGAADEWAPGVGGVVVTATDDVMRRQRRDVAVVRAAVAVLGGADLGVGGAVGGGGAAGGGREVSGGAPGPPGRAGAGAADHE